MLFIVSNVIVLVEGNRKGNDTIVVRKVEAVVKGTKVDIDTRNYPGVVPIISEDITGINKVDIDIDTGTA